MILNKEAPRAELTIWEPRWKDRKVLIPTFKVREHNHVQFTKTNSLPGDYYLSGTTIKKYKIERIGKTLMYAVPLDALEGLDWSENEG